ncbi:MAG: hypothetical protein GC129_00720 [Proteobacteria bacterium]|nr:hypothetical protein [Pseudomonadota bacterium]
MTYSWALDEFMKTLTDEERDCFKRPLIKHGKSGEVMVNVRPGKDLKAILDPSLSQRPDQTLPEDTSLPVALSAEQRRRAAVFTKVLTRFLSYLTGHEEVCVGTFKEVFVASAGIFGWHRGRLLLMYKRQPFIGKGDMRHKLGKPGTFILPQQRQTVKEATCGIIEKMLGWTLDPDLLRKWGPDHVITDPDYDMTWRYRNHGTVFAYDVHFTDAMVDALAAVRGTLMLDDDAPHPDMDALKKDGVTRVLRWADAPRLEKFQTQKSLSLGKELPQILEVFKTADYTVRGVRIFE